MHCVLCGLAKRLLVKLVPSVLAKERDFETKIFTWRLQQCNDKSVWASELDAIAVSRARDLLKCDTQNGIAQLHALAENGSTWSMLLLGWAYQAGTGGNVDDEKAEVWYRRAAEAGCEQAELRLAQHKLRRKDLDALSAMPSSDPDQPWTPSMYYAAIGKLLQPRTALRFEEARKLLEKCASRGDVGAQLKLTVLYLHGKFGFRRFMAGLKWATVFITNSD